MSLGASRRRRASVSGSVRYSKMYRVLTDTFYYCACIVLLLHATGTRTGGGLGVSCARPVSFCIVLCSSSRALLRLFCAYLICYVSGSVRYSKMYRGLSDILKCIPAITLHAPQMSRLSVVCEGCPSWVWVLRGLFPCASCGHLCLGSPSSPVDNRRAGRGRLVWDPDKAWLRGAVSLRPCAPRGRGPLRDLRGRGLRDPRCFYRAFPDCRPRRPGRAGGAGRRGRRLIRSR